MSALKEEILDSQGNRRYILVRLDLRCVNCSTHGVVLISPYVDQIEWIHREFTPSDNEVEEAQEVVDAYEVAHCLY